MTENPFRSKGEVDPRNFCDREDITAELVKTLVGLDSATLSAHRRYGKTWLARLVLKKLEGHGFLTAYLDLSYVHSPLQWIEWYASAVLSAVSASPQELFQLFQRHLPGLGVEAVNATAKGYRIRLRGHFSDATLREVAQPVFELPERIAREAKKKFVVCLDEFPDLADFGGLSEIDRWKDILRGSKNAAYLFASARPKLLARIFDEPGAPLGRTVKSFRLGKIPQEKWTPFLIDRFRKARCKIDREAVQALLDATRCYSYYTQMACRHLLNSNKHVRRVVPGDVAGLADWILEHEDHYYEQIWRGLTKPRQGFIAALAKEPTREVYSADYRIGHRLPPASTLQTAIRSLEEEGLVERLDAGFDVVDPFFKLWIQRKVA